MIDVKCKGCNKLLVKAETFVGAIKCSRCKMVFEYRVYTNIYVTNLYDKELQTKNEHVINHIESTRP